MLDGVGTGVLEGVGTGVFVGVGTGVGVNVGVGAFVGSFVGTFVGTCVGTFVGTFVGTLVGAFVGSPVGDGGFVTTGVSVGETVGALSVGEGPLVTTTSIVGVGVGSSVGVRLGGSVGLFVGMSVGVNGTPVGVGFFAILPDSPVITAPFLADVGSDAFPREGKNQSNVTSTKARTATPVKTTIGFFTFRLPPAHPHHW